MIKAKSDNGTISVTIDGKMCVLQTDFIMIARGVVAALAEVNEDAAKDFHNWLVNDFVEELDKTSDDIKADIMELLHGKPGDELIKSIGEFLEDFLNNLGD